MNTTRVCSVLAYFVLAALILPVAPAIAGQAPPAGPAPTEMPRLIKIRDDVYTIQNVNSNLAELGAFGDLAHNPPGIPLQVNYPDGGSWTDWVTALDTIATLDWEFLVQGHGPVLTKPEFAAFRDRVFSIGERVRALNKQGKTAEEIAATLRPEFNWPAEGRTGNVPDMMQELR